MYENSIDNCMEWITGSKVGSVTFSQRKWVSRILKYAEEYPEDIKILAQNEDGSIFAHVPIKWFKFSPPRKGREYTDEERALAAEVLRAAREKRKPKNNQEINDEI